MVFKLHARATRHKLQNKKTFLKQSVGAKEFLVLENHVGVGVAQVDNEASVGWRTQGISKLEV